MRNLDLDEFRLGRKRPKTLPAEAPGKRAVPPALTRIARWMKSSATGKPGKRRGNGAGHAKLARTHENHQRCAVRVTYASNKRDGQWAAHGRYLARASAQSTDHHHDTDLKHGSAFDGTDQPVDAVATLAEWQAAGDVRLFKLILSPEFGEHANLRLMTQQVMARASVDLARPLQWLAVAHYDTEHPHVHVALRGVDAQGKLYRLPPGYIKSGFRAQAQRVLTEQLGYRSPQQAHEAQRREVDALRFTRLDKALVARAIDHSVELDLSNDAVLIVRMAVLGKMGLAENTGSNRWKLAPTLADTLRALATGHDRQRALHAHQKNLSDPRMPVVFSPPEQFPVRIVAHGSLANTEQPYTLAESVGGKVHFLVDTTREVFFPEADSVSPGTVLIPNGGAGKGAQNWVAAGDQRAFLKSAALRQFAAQVPQSTQWGGWMGEVQVTAQHCLARGTAPTQSKRGRGR